ncbi:DNA polymerase Y family protein [Alcaligenaceae bacterium]|nr:DNA polymerase Y family protein [Alcaligenaceae bacterium]
MSLWISLYLPSCPPAGISPDTVCPAAQADHMPALQPAGAPEAALALLQYTPNVAFFDEDSILLEVQASLSLFKGARNLCRLIRGSLRKLGIGHARLGMAPTALAARLFAGRAARPIRLFGTRRLPRQLDLLPAFSLPSVQPYRDWLEGIGCRSLGQLRRLPRKGLQQRSSPEVVRELDFAYGAAEQHFTWFQPPSRFAQRHELIERLEHTHAILAVAKRLIEQLCGWLQARQEAGSELMLLLHHEKGRHARPPSNVTLRLSEDAWRPEDFTHVLAEQLHTLSLPAAVIAVELIAESSRPRTPANVGLFPEPGQWQRQESRLLDLLQARLGPERVRQPAPGAHYMPEQANLWRSVQAAASPRPCHAEQTQPSKLPPPRLAVQARPFWLLPSPQALVMKGDRPVHQGRPLRLVHGPERLETGWWSLHGHEKRDYFIAQDAQGARYWLYRLREPRAAQETGWFLHGFFA